jgi:hypothetical protein
MTSSQDFESYIPVYDSVPDKWEDARAFLVEQLKKITNGVNIREIGWLINDEIISGKQFMPASGQRNFRTVLRKVIPLNSITTGTTTTPHGITFDSNFTLISLSGAATDPVSRVAIPLGLSASAPFQIEMYMDATNIIVKAGSDRSGYTRAYAIVEYIKEV